MRILPANDRISVSLICRQGPALATAQSGQPRRKHGEPGRPARRGGGVPCADFAPRANGAFVDRAIISLHRPTTFRGGRRLWLGGEPSTTSPHGDRHERILVASRGRGTANPAWRARAGIFRARSRGRRGRRARTCVCHSELAAGAELGGGVNSLFRPFVRIARRVSWNPNRQIVARYLDKWTPQSGGVAKAASPEPAARG